MNHPLSSRDWETLSAYLDRALGPKEIVALEARLSADPVFNAALGELQRTRNALRSLPRLRAPRNFTLTPQMVGQRSTLRSKPSARLAPIFGFASALATFLLILVIMGDWAGILAPSTQRVAQAPTRSSQAVEPMVAAPAEAPAAEFISGTSVPTEAAPLSMEAPLSSQIITTTTPMTLDTGVAASSVMAAETSVFSETLTAPMTMTAKRAVEGSLAPTELASEDFGTESMVTSENPMWTTTLEVMVSPTVTLNFPMTVTLDGMVITETIDLAAQKEPSVEELSQPELTSTLTPPPPSAPNEAPVLVPTDTLESVAPGSEAPTPESSALVGETPLPAQPEVQDRLSTSIPSPTPALEVQTARPGLIGLRILEISLAFLALAGALTAGIIWWSKRI